MKANVSSDHRRVSLQFEGELDAFGLQSLISELAVLRNRLQPEVPRSPPEKGDPGPETNLTVQEDPDFTLRLLWDGRIRLWVRSRGLGWLPFDFPVGNACAMRDYLIANTPEVDPGSDLLFEEFPDGPRTH